MAKYIVTEALAEVLKTSRIQNKIQAKILAHHINKSDSYITKLENGAIRSIDSDELTKIFKFIYSDNPNGKDFFESTLPAILNNLELQLDKKEIEHEAWFLNYDTVARVLPIPEDMIDDLNSRIFTANLSIDKLCSLINANQVLEFIPDSQHAPFNEWQLVIKNQHIDSSYIKLKVETEHITGILNKTITESNYITIHAIVYGIILSENRRNPADVSKMYYEEISHKAVKYLNNYKFYSLSEKRRLTSHAKNKTELESLLSSFDVENIQLVNKIIKCFKLYSDYNISRANDSFSEFGQNLKWDTGFMMALIGFNFHELNSSSHFLKKQLLNEIKELIEKYKETPNEQNIEDYD